jgi:uncharacterized ion transporter superfamily protein YfcC
MLELEFQKRRKIRNRIYSKTTFFILLVIIIFLSHATWKVYKTKIESRKNFEKVLADLEQMRKNEEKLNIDLQRLSTEKGKEEEIRKKFNVAKEGEGVVYVVYSEESKKEEVEELGFFEKIWEKVTRFSSDYF